MTGGRPPGEIELIALRLNEAQRLSGFSRSDLYRSASRGEIIFASRAAGPSSSSRP